MTKKEKAKAMRQKFQEGDIVQHQHDFSCYMITYAGTMNTLPDGTRTDFKFWAYLMQPIGRGDGTAVAFESYDPDPIECRECHKRDPNCDTLKLVLRTGVSRRRLKGVTF